MLLICFPDLHVIETLCDGNGVDLYLVICANIISKSKVAVMKGSLDKSMKYKVFNEVEDVEEEGVPLIDRLPPIDKHEGLMAWYNNEFSNGSSAPVTSKLRPYICTTDLKQSNDQDYSFLLKDELWFSDEEEREHGLKQDPSYNV